MTLESTWLRVLTHNAVNTHIYILNTTSYRASLSTSCSMRPYFLPLSFQGAPAVLVWGGGRDVRCSAACWLIMGRELQLGWPGRVLEPVGLAQGGLATDPGGDGMKSGTSQNTSPGFGAFLAFPPPMAACLCMCIRQRARKEYVWKMQCVHVHKDMYTPCVHVLHCGCKDSTSKAKNRVASVQNPSQDEVAAVISELRVRRTAKPLMKKLSLTDFFSSVTLE